MINIVGDLSELNIFNLVFVLLITTGILGCGLGLGLGLSLSLSDQPYVLELTDTPVGSFLLRGNWTEANMLPSPSVEEGQEMLWHEKIS